MPRLDAIITDARHLIRSLRRSPGFAAIAVGTLALGIGATTAMISAADHVLVRSLPFRDAARLVMMLERDAHGAFRTPSAPTARDWMGDAGAARAFEGISFIRGDGLPLRVGEETRDVGVAFVDQDFFTLLGTGAQRGRILTDADHASDAPEVAVISHRLWMQRFGGAPDVVGRTAHLDSVPTTIVGVLPIGAVYPPFADAWRPMSRVKNPQILQRRGFHADSRTFARLKPGVDSATAVALMQPIGARLAAQYPADQKGWMPTHISMRTEVVGNVRPMLLTLAGAAAAVLLLACANIMNLLLVRVTSRSRELAIRCAIGASRARILRQLFTENVALVALGGVLGLAVAVGALRVARATMAGQLPRAEEMQIDERVLLLAGAVTLATALVAGLWPALRASAVGASAMLRASGLGSGAGRSETRLRRVLVSVQFALALVMLVGTGLLLRSFQRAASTDVGLDPENVISFRVAPPSTYDTPRASAALYDRLMAAARAVPGVENSAFIQHAPFGRAAITTTMEIVGRSALDSSNQVFYRTVSSSYLPTTRARMAAGRWFDDQDMRSPGGSFVINETVARQYWQGANPVGERIVLRRASQARADFGQPISGTVIGVIGDVRSVGRDVSPRAEVYVPYTLETWPWGTLIVRAREGRRAIPSLAAAVRAVEPQLVKPGAAGLAEFTLLSDALESGLRPRKVTMALVSVFAACALLLAAVGMYGVVAYGILQRSHEIGIRKALGATDAGILGMVLKESLIVTAGGVLVGGAASVASARLIRGLLFDTSPADPSTYAGTVVLLGAVALLASWVPARRAMRQDPAVAMRRE